MLRDIAEGRRMLGDTTTLADSSVVAELATRRGAERLAFGRCGGTAPHATQRGRSVRGVPIGTNARPFHSASRIDAPFAESGRSKKELKTRRAGGSAAIAP
jgi:hypothetical protein